MSIRRLPGTPTAGGLAFWTDVANEKGWRIQYNKTLDSVSPLKPYRLLDPQDHLWASADQLEELAQALPLLIEEISHKSPLFKAEDVKAALAAVAQIALTIATRGKGKTSPKL